MNQRAGKTKKGLSSGMAEMNLFKSMKMAAEVLNENDYEDCAFYFEQIVDYLSSGKKLPLDKREMERALGV